MNKIRLDNKDFYYQVFYKKIKNMYLRVTDDKILIITCNRTVSKMRIEDFILRSKNRILKNIDNKQERIPLYDETTFLLFGKEYDPVYRYGMKKESITVIENEIIIEMKSDIIDKKKIERFYGDILLNEIQSILSQRKLDLISFIDLNGLTFKTQLMKSRFGSCIPKKRIIKLNSILARFPKEFTEAILIHELVHLAIPNHQKDFYDKINLLVPNYKKIRKELNRISRKYVI